MTVTLKLTNQEVDNLINGKLKDRFETIFDNIPFYHPDNVPDEGETHHDYCEDDGREFRWLIVKDKLTGEEYCVCYTYNREYPNDLESLSENIEIVENFKESSLYEE